MNEPEPIATGSERWLLLAWVGALFAACLFLHTRHNEFPYFYHPDEPGKVEQLLTGRWNFHHPMLLLSTTRVLVKLARVPQDEQRVVEVGRWTSAIFIAVAVVALSVLAFAWRGWTAAIASGAGLLLHHQFFELAHYLKEDSALLAGFALTLMMLLACWWRPTLGRTALLGLACGLAISGKYLGVIALAVALPVLWKVPERRGARLGVFGAALVATLLAVNLPMLLQLATFQESFGREVELVVKGQRGMTRSVPHTQYWNTFRDNTTPAIWALLVVFLHARWRERRSLTLPEWILIGFPFAYLVALSFSPKTNDRYFLPATALFTLQAAIGTVDFARAWSWRHTRRRWLAGSVAVFLLFQVFSLPRPLDWKSFAEYWRAFQVDDHADLATWVREKLPLDAVIAKDNRIMLPDPARKKDAKRMAPIPQKVLGARYAADLGTLGELRRKGVTHVIVSESDYGRFFVKSLRPQEGEKADFARRKGFYEALFRSSETPLFERERGTVIYLHPGIRVYRLPEWTDAD